jgi:hypothetical protein
VAYLLLEDVRLKLLPCRSALEALEEVLALPTNEQLLTVAFLWSCWLERNRGNHGEPHQYVEQFQYSIRRHVDEWKVFLQKKYTAVATTDRGWEKPPADVVKINIGAA